MKKIIFLLLLAPALCFAAETEFFQDANFYCHCIVSKPDDISYSVDDWAVVTFSATELKATIETVHDEVKASVQYVKFGPWIRFSGDCDTTGKGFALLGLISFQYVDYCEDLAFKCRGFRFWRRLDASE